MKITKVQTSAGTSTYTVTDNNVIIGLLTHDNSRYSEQPWKAFTGIGATAKMIGYFFEADGGRNAAIAAIKG